MITLKDLEGFKLVKEEYVASVEMTQDALERVFMQGSQGWGVRREDGVILRLARDLKIALALANSADENGRLLKGAQMALGREKKIKDNLLAGNEVLQTQLGVLQKALDARDQADEARATGEIGG